MADPSTVVLVPARRPSDAGTEHARLRWRAKRLAWGGNVWHLVEFAVAVGAGVAASSVALVAFGIDSVIELLAGGVIVWLFTGQRVGSGAAERRAQQVIAVMLAVYVAVETVRALTGVHPDASWVGIGLAAVTAPTMPLLARANQRVGRELGSRATESEGSQNMICAYLSVALLVGLGANALLGWWWADPAAGAVIAVVAMREGRDAWRGVAACDCC